MDARLATITFRVEPQTGRCWSARRARDFMTRVTGTAGLLAMPFWRGPGQPHRALPPRLRPPGSPRTGTLSRCLPRSRAGPEGARPARAAAPPAAGWLWRRGRRRLAVPGVCAGPPCPWEDGGRDRAEEQLPSRGALGKGAGTLRAAALPASRGGRDNRGIPGPCSCRLPGTRPAPRLCKRCWGRAVPQLPPAVCAPCSAQVTEPPAVPCALHRDPRAGTPELAPPRCPGVPCACPCSL